MSLGRKKSRFRRRMRLARAVKASLESLEYEEVETPLLVRAPGMEPAIQAFESRFFPELGRAKERPLWLHTSPEYAMKRLVADGWQRTYQLCKVFRNGEVTETHNPEFTMLEFYRAQADYSDVMDDLETVVREGARALGATRISWGGCDVDFDLPFERVTVADAMRRQTGLDIRALSDADAFRKAAREKGYHVPASGSWDDVFFSVFLTAVEPGLGQGRATYLVDYPVSMASLSQVKASDPTVAERFELYAAGLELANGYGELTDQKEQRARLEAEQEERRRAGHAVYPLDEKFLEAVGRLPRSSGVALGFDRLAMLLTGAETIADVLLFPAHEDWVDD